MPSVIPVVVHRLFGTKYVPLPLSRGSRRSSAFSFDLSRFLPDSSLVRIPSVDMDHGTRRSLESIRALFSEEASLDYTRGWNVNALWNTVDIHFSLVGIVDEMIESDRADFIPQDARLEPNLTPFNHSCVINVYFARELEGRWGNGHADIRPCEMNQKGRVLMGDRWHLEEGILTRKESWRRDVIVLAHELGHALTLPHTGNIDQVMYGNGTTRDSVIISAVQGQVAKYHGRRYRPPLARSSEITREIPHIRRYLREELPVF